MKNVFDMITDVIGLIDVGPINSIATGGIWPEERPGVANKIEIVVNGLGVTNTQFQNGRGNVNIHAPSIKRTTNGKQSDFPDYVKLSSLVKLLQERIDAKYELSFSTEVGDGSGKIFKDTDGSFFANIPFYYRSYNKEYNNI